MVTLIGVFFDPFADLLVTGATGDHGTKLIGTDACKIEEHIIQRTVEVVLAESSGEFGAALVQGAASDDIAAQRFTRTARKGAVQIEGETFDFFEITHGRRGWRSLRFVAEPKDRRGRLPKLSRTSFKLALAPRMRTSYALTTMPPPTSPASTGEVIDLDIAILGGGFGGVYCARQLGKRIDSARVGILADENHMTFQPMLPEVAGGALPPRHVVNPIRQLARLARVLKCEVTGMEAEEEIKTVHASAGDFTPDVTIRCRHLVLALGAVVDLSRIPGMPEHAFLLRNVGDAMKLRAAIVGRVEEANLVTDKGRRRRLLDFVVVGGGYSGTETAGQMIDLLNSIHRFYRNVDADDFSVSLIHSRAVLLPTLAENLGEYTRECLEKNGVHVIVEHRVKAVTARQVILDDGTALPAALVVSTVGNAPHPRVSDLIEKHSLGTQWGKIETDRFLRVPGLENVWAVGDCAAVPFAGEGEEWCPPNAQFALRQGQTAGDNIAACFPDNRLGLKEFRFQGLGELAAIGHHKAVANVFGMNFSGFIAWWMWRTIYLSKLPGLDRKLRVMVEWTLDMFFPRDISLLTPNYTSGVKETHLEEGDLLFHSGEPAFSFYMVKGGSIDIVDDERKLVRTIQHGGHFGERALMEDRRWRYNAVAREPSTLVSLGEHVFRQLIAGCGDISELLTQTAATYASVEQIDQVMERIPESVRSRTADELMASKICSLRHDQTVSEALDLLQREPHSTYPVMDDNGSAIGVLRRGQLYDLLKGDDVSMSTPLGKIPLSYPPKVEPKMSAHEVLEKLIRSSKTKALVVGDDQKLAGIISLVDLLEAPRERADLI